MLRLCYVFIILCLVTAGCSQAQPKVKNAVAASHTSKEKLNEKEVIASNTYLLQSWVYTEKALPMIDNLIYTVKEIQNGDRTIALRNFDPASMEYLKVADTFINIDDVPADFKPIQKTLLKSVVELAGGIAKVNKLYDTEKIDEGKLTDIVKQFSEGEKLFRKGKSSLSNQTAGFIDKEGIWKETNDADNLILHSQYLLQSWLSLDESLRIKEELDYQSYQLSDYLSQKGSKSKLQVMENKTDQTADQLKKIKNVPTSSADLHEELSQSIKELQFALQRVKKAAIAEDSTVDLVELRAHLSSYEKGINSLFDQSQDTIIDGDQYVHNTVTANASKQGQQDESIVLNNQFVQQLHQGLIPSIPFGIGSSEQEVLSRMGKPVSSHVMGDWGKEYSFYNKYGTITYIVNTSGVVTTMNLVINGGELGKQLRMSKLKSLLGTPTSEGQDPTDSQLYRVEYNLGNALKLTVNSDDPHGLIQFMSLSKNAKTGN